MTFTAEIHHSLSFPFQPCWKAMTHDGCVRKRVCEKSKRRCSCLRIRQTRENSQPKLSSHRCVLCLTWPNLLCLTWPNLQGVKLEEMARELLAVGGPIANATRADAVRLHDDKVGRIHNKYPQCHILCTSLPCTAAMLLSGSSCCSILLRHSTSSSVLLIVLISLEVSLNLLLVV